MVREAKQPKRAHPFPHCLTKFQSPSKRDAHVRAVHEKWRDYKSSAPTATASSGTGATWCGTVGRCTRGGATTSARTAAAACQACLSHRRTPESNGNKLNIAVRTLPTTFALRRLTADG